jgi:hypothetical protein
MTMSHQPPICIYQDRTLYISLTVPWRFFCKRIDIADKLSLCPILISNMSLCTYCKHALECRPPDAYVKHHKRIKDLEASSYRCQLCRLILSGLNNGSQCSGVDGTSIEEYRYISLVSRSSRGGGIRRRIMFSGKLWTGTVMRNVFSLTNEGTPYERSRIHCIVCNVFYSVFVGCQLPKHSELILPRLR